MNRKDTLKQWFGELPPEQASSDFSTRVMQRVMSEWSLNPYKYQPIISKKAWWAIGFIAVVFTAMLFSLHSTILSTSGNHSEFLYGINFTQLFSLFAKLFEKLNNISPAVAIGAMAIIALWFFDQLFTRTVKH